MKDQTLKPASNEIGTPAAPAPAPDSIEAQLAGWTRTLDRFLEQADRSVAIGRELVEQRALNLDLQRQIHRLEDEVQSLRARLQQEQDSPASLPANQGQDGRSSLSRTIRGIFKR